MAKSNIETARSCNFKQKFQAKIHMCTHSAAEMPWAKQPVLQI